MVQVSTHVIVRIGWFRLKIVEKFPRSFIKIVDEKMKWLQKALWQFPLLQCNALTAREAARLICGNLFISRDNF